MLTIDLTDARKRQLTDIYPPQPYKQHMSWNSGAPCSSQTIFALFYNGKKIIDKPARSYIPTQWCYFDCHFGYGIAGIAQSRRLPLPLLTQANSQRLVGYIASPVRYMCGIVDRHGGRESVRGGDYYRGELKPFSRPQRTLPISSRSTMAIKSIISVQGERQWLPS